MFEFVFGVGVGICLGTYYDFKPCIEFILRRTNDILKKR